MKPKNRDRITDSLFDGLTPPALPPELRSRVLAAARAEAGVAPVPELWTRIWENRWLRVIWLTSIVALAFGHIALAPQQPSPTVVTAGFHLDDAMDEFLRPIRIEKSASPHLGRAADNGHGLVEIDDGGNGQ